MLINLTYPAVANVYLGILMGVVTFQVYDFTDLYDNVFSLDDTGNDLFSY